ncbi:LOW QUALITY PROTEIN: phenoloxidase-activating factor 2-like [Panulirus ornatus]|uniref:LOW QUALITY PROTEIN: phenoloxidase-activating factor 2-like n=1 Tax=Panulirus ornatus TaxID=150431 RepID=UPI003A8B0E6D
MESVTPRGIWMRGVVATVTLLLLLVAASAANPRERRQANGCFWWDANCNSNSGGSPQTEAPADPVTEDTNTGGVRSNPQSEDTSYTLCSGGQGKCVPYYLCKDGNIITDGAGLIDIRFGNADSKQSNSECPQYLDVCCTLLEPNPTTPKPDTYKPRCGQRNPEGVNARILGFEENQAQFGEFPWMAAVLREEIVAEKAVNLYVCGGSLIHPSIVLTAAHCVASHKANILKVRLGEWDTQRTYELYPHQDRGVTKVVIHEGYLAGPLFNDFALLILDEPADLVPNVDTICLPGTAPNYNGNDCWATGWGKDKFGKEGVFQNVLKKIQLKTQSHQDCQTALRTTRLGYEFILDSSFLCAGGEPGLDTCKGDGGSPLVCKLPNNDYVQAGIVAWGIGCGEDGIPGVYANVPYAVDWIKTKADEELRHIGRYTPGYW